MLLEGYVNDEKLNRWRSGLTLPDGFRTGPAKVILLEGSRDGTWVRVVLREGHKRQIREIADLLGHPAKRIIRTHIGSLALGDLPPGKSRELTYDEVKALRDEAGTGKQRRPPQQRSSAAKPEGPHPSRRPSTRGRPTSRSGNRSTSRRPRRGE